MAFKYGDVDLATKVYGLSTDNSRGGMSTVKLSDGYKIGGSPIKAVPYNSAYMPFNTFSYYGFKDNGAQIFTYSKYAGVGRFITSVTEKISRSGRSGSKVPIYYKGGGTPHSLGTLYLGSTSSPVRDDVPPVILIAIQGAGGNGGSGEDEKTWLGTDRRVSGGGGGGSGAFTCYQVEMPYDGSTNLIGYYEFNGGSASLYSKANIKFAEAAKGGDGGNGVVDWGFGDFTASQKAGNGGAAGKISYYTPPTGWWVACILNGIRYSGSNGAVGGYGGRIYYGFSTEQSGPNNGYGMSGYKLTVNSGDEGSMTGKSGASKNFMAGGGAGSMFSSGGTSNGIGNGGNGSSNGSGSTGGQAGIRFYW